MAQRQFRDVFFNVERGQVTADFPSAAAGFTVTVTGLAFTGAQVGDMVLVSPVVASTAGFAFSGAVTAANTISVNALNGTAGVVDLASASYNVVLLRPKF